MTCVVNMRDYRELPGAKQVIDTWVARVGLKEQRLISLSETHDPYVVSVMHQQHGWDGRVATNRKGEPVITQARISVKRPFPFDRIIALRRLRDEGAPEGKTIQQCIVIIQNGGDPWASSGS